MNQPICVSFQKPTYDPFKKFWCQFIETTVFAARQGESAAIRWFDSDMWDKISGFLFEPEVIKRIENAALRGGEI